MIPGETQWTVIFSKMSTAWGSFSYKQDEDALRVTVKPQTAVFHDALAYDFDDVKPRLHRNHHELGQGRSALQSCGSK